ncbi:ATP-binding cassette domain-containing protein [Corynebacterium epidermidicanis]|uniref:ABC-type cobalt transport system, ATPase component n=1 Tax=Corynebacterium epidermidicanis TaxID=1050174 RepID=A0A0G3GNU5_9CORY|nr:ATP-binding cassette domain-containing protein [Corynebacterium epidermidicanis]AKK02215.1 ABC-type cobalt transport system, ATPase component [Corynebacterium epidermidicanis]
MGLTQVIGYSGAGLSAAARGIPDAVYVSATPLHHVTYLRATVIEELAFGLEQRGVDRAEMQSRCESAAAALDISNLLERDPTRLSGGQTRRMVIAAALALQPQRLVLDDPFFGLDKHATAELSRVLRSLQETMEIWVFSHLPAFAEFPVEVIGDDPRGFQPPRWVTPQRRQGTAFQAAVTAFRGVPGSWWRKERVDFKVGPVEISVPNQGIVWLCGPNGAGKSTLLHELAKQPACGLLTQDPYDQLLFSTARAMASDAPDQHPYDLSARNLRLTQLRMICGLGRPIVLLDEPEVGLDGPGRVEAIELIARHCETPGNGVVLVTHDEDFAAQLALACGPMVTRLLD